MPGPPLPPPVAPGNAGLHTSELAQYEVDAGGQGGKDRQVGVGGCADGGGDPDGGRSGEAVDQVPPDEDVTGAEEPDSSDDAPPRAAGPSRAG